MAFSVIVGPGAFASDFNVTVAPLSWKYPFGYAYFCILGALIPCVRYVTRHREATGAAGLYLSNFFIIVSTIFTGFNNQSIACTPAFIRAIVVPIGHSEQNVWRVTIPV
jgi:hypothetical protein